MKNFLVLLPFRGVGWLVGDAIGRGTRFIVRLVGDELN